LFNVFLKGQSNVNFIGLDQNVGSDDLQEVGSLLVGYTPTKDLPVVGFKWITAIIKVTTKTVMKSLDGWQVGHINTGRNIVANVMRFAGYLLLEDVNKAFAVKDTGHVVNVHSSLQVGIGMVANSEKTRCPARKGAEGQPRAKQVASQSLGVCNEQVPPTEVKICSELHGNMQRLVETANPAIDIPYCYRYVNAGNRLQYEVPPLAPSRETQYGASRPRQILNQSGRNGPIDRLGREYDSFERFPSGRSDELTAMEWRL